MRLPSYATAVQAVAAFSLAATLAGCSSGGSRDTFQTASLRPKEGMARSTPRRYPDGSTNRGYYSGNAAASHAAPPRRYVDPGQPTPREMAAAYDRGPATPRPTQNIETASVTPSRPHYDPNARWQQPPSAIATGTPGPVPTGYYGRPRQAAATHGPQVVEVREGDTLYALSRRHGVEVAELVAANQLADERIAIGQRIVVPAPRR